MHDWIITLALAVGCAAALYIGRRTFPIRTSLPLPPGPSGLPWVGNVIEIDTRTPWKTYADWARVYGDLIHFRLMGRDLIVINSEKIAKDLLESRSSNYSDRPRVITNEMCGLGFSSVDLRYGDRWRLHRRFFHQTFRLDAAPRFWPLQHRKACHFIRQLFDTPNQIDDHVFEYTASVVLNSVYDYDPVSRKDELIQILANMLKITVPATRPDIAIFAGGVPFLLHLPSWFPGMSFKKQMEIASVLSKQYLERLFEYSLRRGPTHNAVPSMVHNALQTMEDKGVLSEERIVALKEASGTAFLAAAESSHSVLMTFILMMVLNPVVQEKAQAQIDDMVGKDRLPAIEERPLLPLVDAIFRETLRYNPIAPLSVPHASMEDDVYDGFHIPKGAVVLTNLWGMAHDESRFPNPHAFIPERFINDDGSLKPNETDHIAFGFGRRICVGRHFADTSVWSIIAKVLAVFKISKALDDNGIEIPVDPRFSSGIAIRPLPFKFSIVPRVPGMDAEKLEQLIATSTP